MIGREKKIWCQEQDDTLRKLYEEEGEKSWSTIAKRLSSEYTFPRKSAKQCRERYENHISCEGIRVEWNPEEEQKLIELHNEMGNKWSSIADNIPGKYLSPIVRTDNCVKNHFYSKLRKILRKLNSIIHNYLRKQYRPINIGTLYKIVEATEERFKEDPSCGYEVSIHCQDVQNKMLHVSMLRQEEFQTEERIKIYADLVKDIYSVSRLYKRKSKKVRNSAIQAPNTRKKKIRESHPRSKNSEELGYDSDSSSVFEEEAEVEKEAINKENKPEVVVQEQQEGIRDMLKDAGLLKEEEGAGNGGNGDFGSGFPFSSRSSFKSYSEKNIDSDNGFFEDSENEKGKRSRRRMSFERYRSSMLDDPSDKSEREGYDIGFG